MRLFLLAVPALAAVTGCHTPLQRAGELCGPRRTAVPRRIDATSSAATPRRLVIVTVDGVRWQEVFGGVDAELARRSGLAGCAVVGARQLMPELHRLVAEGAALGAPGMGPAPRTGNRSFVSLPGYLELFTGRVPSCTDNECEATREPTILDELRTTVAASPHDIAVIGSWEVMERAVARASDALAVSVGRGGGRSRERLRGSPELERLLDEGARSASWPGWSDYRPDRHTAALALAYLRARQPRVLVVGLGDPDELAHRGDYPGYLASLLAVDDFLADLRSTLEALGLREETLLVVTTDHGRAESFVDHGPHAPESGQVWIVASGAGVLPQGPIASSRVILLADVAPTIRRLFGLGSDGRASAGRPIEGLLPSAGSGDVAAGRGGRWSGRASPGS